MSFARGFVGAVAALALSLCTTGCLRKVLIDGQIGGNHEGGEAVNTLHDFEVARAVARAGMGQFEGLYKLAPYNEEILMLLTRGWAGSTFAFTEDDYELAQEKKDDQLIAYHRQRTIAGFDRAKFFAIQMLKLKADGFDEAQRNADTMNAWLKKNFRDKKEAEPLLWASFAWIGHVGAAMEPETIANLYVGVAMAERSAELDEQLEYGTAHIILGAYHARPNGELEEAKKHFDIAMKINGGKFLSTQFNYGRRYYCMKSDKPNFEKMMNEVLAAGDPIPEARLQNLIAKRKARRYLDNKIFQEDCGFIG